MKLFSIKIPGLGRFAIGRESREGAALFAQEMFDTHLMAIRRDYRGNVREVRDLGSGLVTNVGVLAMANDPFWAAPSGASLATLALAKYMSSGTGATAAAATDIKLQTPITGLAASVVTGTQTLVSAANAQKLQVQGTITYDVGGPYSVTEWGLFTDPTLTSATGSPFTAGSATTGTVTGTPFTASSGTVRGEQQFILENTGNATPSWGLVLSNTTGVVTVPAWYKVSDGTLGANPANTNAYTIRPVMWDHKVFGAITANAGDSIQFTYTLTISSGG